LRPNIATDRDYGQISPVDLQHGYVAMRVAADDLGPEFTAVSQRHRDLIGAFDHVVVRQDVTVSADNDTGPNAAFTARWLLWHTGHTSTTAEQIAEEVLGRHWLLPRTLAPLVAVC
jgi:hypothetical protein